MDDVIWGALALALTAVGGLYTWWAFRHRGSVPGTRGIALTLLPAAAWLTGTLELLADVAGAASRWAAGVVLSPAFWVGAALAGTSVLLLVVTGLLTRRDRPVPEVRAAKPAGLGRGSTRPKQGASDGGTAGDAAGDEDFADIEAMLRRRGIE